MFLKYLSVFLVVLVTVLAIENKGSIEDVQHIVIFMQENRAFDHYYGSLKGVRGFNDRAAPLLPSGKSVWHQPTSSVKPTQKAMCGCGACDLLWNPIGDNELQELFNELDCASFADLLSSANPSITVSQGEYCSTLLSQILNSTIQHMKVSYQLSSHSSCPANLTVSGLNTDTSSVFQERKVSAEEYMLPFHLKFNETSATCMPAPEMDYPCDLKMWNKGRMDAWNTARAPGFGMSYFKRTDLPYYYALADAFTIGDQYFQSTFTPTNPNRLHQFSGSNGLSVGAETVITDDAEPEKGINWETLAETFEKYGVSWKVYQEEDNFDDNAFAWFEAFKNIAPGNPLFDKGMIRAPAGELVKAFGEDVANDTLPQVSFIIAPTWLSEHATNHPQDGEDLTARLVEVLSRPENQAVYAKTVFFLNYDEGGQFFDHHWTPTPPVNEYDGKSTVSTVGEITTKIEKVVLPFNPIGLGFRVPFIIISPWTRGPYTFSEVADHTSLIKFIEKRFKIKCPNLSPWRRAVVSDLTAAFDFQNPDYSWPVFPSTKNNTNDSKRECGSLPYPSIPTKQSLPIQEPGTRLSRPLPYSFEITDEVVNNTLIITMRNKGRAAGVFYIYNLKNSVYPPKKYTVEGGLELSDSFDFNGTYNYSLHGPNGFVRKFSGVERTQVKIDLIYNEPRDSITFKMTSDKKPCTFIIKDETGLHSLQQWNSDPIPQYSQVEKEIFIAETGNWYDFSVQAICHQYYGRNIARRFMGHMETNKTTTTDPAMGAPMKLKVEQHPDVPLKHRMIDSYNLLKNTCMKRRSRHKDECWELMKYEME